MNKMKDFIINNNLLMSWYKDYLFNLNEVLPEEEFKELYFDDALEVEVVDYYDGSEIFISFYINFDDGRHGYYFIFGVNGYGEMTLVQSLSEYEPFVDLGYAIPFYQNMDKIRKYIKQKVISKQTNVKCGAM